ncbi:MAG: hypothetical protein ACD_55C00138G0005 [uncultured bacterium]|uniref:Uncharacterized protein n=1 Tax=Citrifermentans bemidjiense (strain ATCC BAA-1014 / DSM 16622 / JCM 12645 / Bem) TaxID=404380 RepID=B5E7X2_CITBB|nr:hypothetical protein [Citrifermentans bemidjiense]ACH38508.1 hypothetical protein Gbem_1490 [Citrifermentans bemidjiense Bem]EKD59157.1 MAG: hypothetical protein ACD_55C00138G0005 [uncultured bacterium]
MRYINSDKILAAQLTTPAENPLAGDDTRLIDVWFDGSAVRKQLFKKVNKTEQEAMAQELEDKGFIRSGNLLINPRAVLFAEMEHEIVGGLVTIGYQDNGKPVELKVDSDVFKDLCERLAREKK